MNGSLDFSDDRATRRRGWFVYVGLALILVAAAALRLHDVGRESFWCDEFLTAEMTAGRGYYHEEIPSNTLVREAPDLTSVNAAAPWWSVWPNQTDEGYPPLYVLAARFWRQIAGDRDVALRMLSVITSLVMIALLFDAVRIMHGNVAATGAAAIAAVAWPQIMFAQEARGYTMLLAAGAGALAALARLEHRGPGKLRAVGLAISAAALLLTHYYAHLAAIALGIYALVRLRGVARRYALASLITAAVIAAALWTPFVLRQLDAAHVAASQFYFGDDNPGRIARLAQRLALLPINYFYEPLKRDRALALVGALAYPLLIVLAWRRRDLRLWIVWFFACIAPVALVDLLARTRQLDLLRYTLLAAPAAYAIVAAAPALRNRKVGWLVPAAVVLACVLSMRFGQETKPDWRALSRAWAEFAQPGEVTLFMGSDYPGPYSPSLTYLSTTFYRRPTGPIVILDKPAAPELLRELSTANGVMVIASDFSPPPDALLPDLEMKRVAFEPYAGKIYRVIPSRASSQPSDPRAPDRTGRTAHPTSRPVPASGTAAGTR